MQTKDTNLVAFLIARGDAKLDTFQTDGKTTTWILKDVNSQAVIDFSNGELDNVNIKQFLDKKNRLLDILFIHVGGF